METKVTALLNSKGLSYKLLYHTKQVFTCEEAAKERKVPLNEMIKCILLVDKQKNYFLACLTAEKMLDPKKVSALMNCARLSFASDAEMEEILGYVKGAIPPLLLKSWMPIIFDNEITKKEKVNISSGGPLAGIELKTIDLIALIKPKFGNISK